MQTKTVRVVRAFYFQGKSTKVGDVLDLPHVFALEMIAAHKAEPAEKPKEVVKSEQKQTEDTQKQAQGGKYAR